MKPRAGSISSTRLLDLEGVFEFAIVGLGSKFETVSGVDQMRCDPYVVARLGRRALGHVRDVEPARDPGDLDPLVFEREKRGARCHPEHGNPGQQISLQALIMKDGGQTTDLQKPQSVQSMSFEVSVAKSLAR